MGLNDPDATLEDMLRFHMCRVQIRVSMWAMKTEGIMKKPWMILQAFCSMPILFELSGDLKEGQHNSYGRLVIRLLERGAITVASTAAKPVS